MTCDENLNVSKSTTFTNDSKCEERRDILPMRNDGTIDYDGKFFKFKNILIQFLMSIFH